MSGLRKIMVDESALATTTCIYTTDLFCFFESYLIWSICVTGWISALMCLMACFSPCLVPLVVPLALLGGGGGTVIHLPPVIYY